MVNYLGLALLKRGFVPARPLDSGIGGLRAVTFWDGDFLAVLKFVSSTNP
jgi:hypothetical protein